MFYLFIHNLTQYLENFVCFYGMQIVLDKFNHTFILSKIGSGTEIY